MPCPMVSLWFKHWMLLLQALDVGLGSTGPVQHQRGVLCAASMAFDGLITQIISALQRLSFFVWGQGCQGRRLWCASNACRR